MKYPKRSIASHYSFIFELSTLKSITGVNKRKANVFINLTITMKRKIKGKQSGKN